MRQFAWYAPHMDIIVLQTVMEDCSCNFELGYEDAIEWHSLMAINDFDVTNFAMYMLGEL